MRDIYRVVGFVLVAIVGVLGVLAALHIVMSLPFTAAEHDKRAEWVGAIGTVGTLIGTIFLATAETRRRHRHELLVARLRGASMVLRLARARIVIAQVIELMNDASQAFNASQPFHLGAMKFVTVSTWTIEDIVLLAALPDKAAAKLASALDGLSFASTKLSEAAVQEWRFPYDSYHACARDIGTQLETAYDLVQEAEKTCIDGAKLLNNAI